MRLSITIVLLLLSAVVVLAGRPSKSESGCHALRTGSAIANSLCLYEESSDPHQAVYDTNPIVALADSAQTEADDSLYIQAIEPAQSPWLAAATNDGTGLEPLKDKIGATLTIRSRLKARSEGALGKTPWIGMAMGLMCTTLAAVVLG
ncbi:hypothetical protein BGW36DRAFT_360494 [Talaromyces proteolyticus]|uniref:Uncharacterized protein n=1 Tax=Talaromyces proteolyticus TaxID=1131652 RepID=A0AAD4KRM6_9EURO|nr:uncharacterized protein BGW36DRAFT_360494 [Talaromyces proteolyticus]KAH8696677.1 hypothetical protein BGW36DRAFT_360494 [Talaromyces proteolyticus]